MFAGFQPHGAVAWRVDTNRQFETRTALDRADELLKNAQRQQPQGMDIDWSKLADITQLYENESYLVWVQTDNQRLVKAQNQNSINFGVDAFADDPVLSGIFLTSSGVVTLTNYNEKVTINLPEAAQQAVEVSPDNLVGQ